MNPLLTPRDLADALGTSESSVRRWCDSGELNTSRTVGGHRRIALREALTFIRRRELPIPRPDVLALAGTLTHRDSDVPLWTKLAQALESGDGDLTGAILNGLYLAGTKIADIFDGPVRQAMQYFGEKWPDDERGIFIEHRATMMCLHAIAELRSQFKPVADRAPHAIGGAAPDDPYIIPSAMAATVLADVGFNDTNLGPNTPFNVIAAAAGELGARLVWVSITATESRKGVAEGMDALAGEVSAFGADVLVGGRGASTIKFAPRDNLHVLGSMAEMGAFAKGVISTPVTKPRRRSSSVRQKT